MNKTYDYIIVGSGASGLSLILHMDQYDYFKDKKILLIDKVQKNTNDRTWCFWEEEGGALDQIVHRQWKDMDFKSPERTFPMRLDPYAYKMIRGIDFYELANDVITKNDHIDIVLDEVIEVRDKTVVGQSMTYHASSYIFNSIHRKPEKKPTDHTLYQHFKGYFLRTEQPSFKNTRPILMDFSIDQDLGCDFVYLLPLSDHEALVEYTSFSEKVLLPEAYDPYLIDYIEQRMGLTSYDIAYEEFGIIPMTNAQFPKRQGDYVINMGIAGGMAKPSTGYTFSFIQKHAKLITENLLQGKDPLDGQDQGFSKYQLYDSIFLNVLVEKPIPSWKVFDLLFKQLPPSLVLKFLDEKTSWWEDLRIMNTMPKIPFTIAALREMGRLM